MDRAIKVYLVQQNMSYVNGSNMQRELAPLGRAITPRGILIPLWPREPLRWQNDCCFVCWFRFQIELM